jgi:hypothetical protein
VVLNGFCDSKPSFKSQNNCSEDGRDDCNALQLIQKVSKSVGVNPVVDGTKVFANGFQQGADDEDVVKSCQTNEDPVEDGRKTLAQQNGNGDAISGQPNHSNYYLGTKQMK